MPTKDQSRFPRQDYTEEQLFPHSYFKPNKKERRQEEDYQGGIFSDSEIGGESQNQQNPWQGSQSQWQQS